MLVTDKTISKAIDKLRDEVTRSNGAISVNMNGVTYVIDKKYVAALRERENQYISREAKGNKKSKEVSPAARSKILEDLERKVETAFQKSVNMKVSPGLRRAILDVVRARFDHRKESPKNTTLVPRRLYLLDNHFTDFLNGITLDLLANKMDGASPALRKELKDFEASVVDFLRTKRVGASTLLTALVSHYISSKGLRLAKSADMPSVIRIDDRLRRLLQAPMDSSFEKLSFVKNYKPSVTEKKEKDGSTKLTVGGYRVENPRSSVMDYLMYKKSRAEIQFLKDGYLLGDDIMVLVSAHLIPSLSLDKDDRADLSMDMVDQAYVNPFVYNLIALQAVISASQHTSGHTMDMPVRSPSRSPRRSASRESRTPTRGRSKTPTRATSPGTRASSRGRTR